MHSPSGRGMQRPSSPEAAEHVSGAGSSSRAGLSQQLCLADGCKTNKSLLKASSLKAIQEIGVPHHANTKDILVLSSIFLP